MQNVQIGDREIGPDQPVYIVAEIGINHNGDVGIAKKLVDIAAASGCDAVKFQKRTPDLAVPEPQRDVMRETPWGLISYIDYKHRIEFGEAEYREIDAHCEERGIIWFASPWDKPSVDFLEQFDPPAHKIASASLTDDALLRHVAATGRPIILSTGMSTMNEIRHAIDVLGCDQLIPCHSTSTYPCPPDELNLRVIHTLRDEFDAPIGYSGHEVGLQTTLAAVSLGACLIERHITLDRAMWGTDQAASVEPPGLMRLVRDVRVIEAAMGDGVKKVYASEMPIMEKLRGA